MSYFYIFGNLCSVLGFVGLVLQSLGTFNNSVISRWLIICLIFFTVIFWLIFYLKPLNPLARIINSRIDFSGEYVDSNKIKYNIVEGEFNLSTWYVHVPLPPFEEPPIIRILSGTGNEDFPLPQIGDITEDSFIAKANMNSVFGKWKYRAKGKLLKRINVS
jgi:hypothetical protein